MSNIKKVIENGKEYYVLYRYNGDIIYHKDEGLTIMHREKGPAVEYKNGHREWLINDKHHREGGPAIEYARGGEEWWVNGKRHREGGPAMSRLDGRKYYFLNGIQYEEEKYWVIVRLGGFA